ncbi:hypothetical protein RhiirA4_483579, partial [Rhizophagus irregularis]
MPTAIINHNLIYNIKDIADNQLQAKSTNFLIQLNDTGLLGKITTLRLKQLQHKFWIEDNIVSIFPFDNNFYKKLFYNISVNNKLNIEKYKITGSNVIIRNILETEKFFNNIYRIKKDGVIFLDQLIGISNSYLINWYTLKLKSFREDMRNYIKPKKWYRELQSIVTIDGKTLKPEYKMSAVFHFKGYNMAQCEIDRSNISKKLTFIGIWNNRNNNVEIGVLIKKSGIDGQNNLIIRHLNVINNVDFRSSVIQLQKCSGCELDNIEQLSEKNYNCNILINTNDSLIIGVQSNSAYHSRTTLNNNNLKAILQTNLLDITDLNYNDFLFKNNWKNYETTINQSVISIDHLVKINDNLITKLLDFSHDRNQLLIIQRQLLESSTRKFEIYTDGSVHGFGSQQCTISFGFIIVKNNMILHSFRSEISYFPSSNKA